jgi:hypothetical protein
LALNCAPRTEIPKPQSQLHDHFHRFDTQTAADAMAPKKNTKAADSINAKLALTIKVRRSVKTARNKAHK